MKRMLNLVVVLAVIVLPASASAVTYNSRWESRVVDRINDHRVNKVRPGPCIDRYAEKWARHLAKTGAFYHSDLNGPLYGCNVRQVGEIIARGYDTPRQTVWGWMSSPGHREQIETESYRRIGVGAVKDSSGRWVVVVLFRR